MELTTYGKSTGFCIDPIEKKPLFHFLPGTAVLSFGTAGCNLGCKFCQNWSISKARSVEALSASAMPEAIAAAALDHGCQSVAFTYNDPVLWAEYAIDTAKACRERGVKTVAVTAGYIQPQARPEFFSAMDAANVDLKSFSEHFYHHLTLGHLEPVLDTLRWLRHESDVWLEITNLLIPDANDSPDELRRMAQWVLENLGDETPVHFTAFHPDFRMRDRPPTPRETLLAAYEIARAAGLKFVYVGNVHDVDHETTYCPGCGAALIERDWHVLGRYGLVGNCCGNCGRKIPGVFGDAPGDWGRRRLPVEILSAPEDRLSRPEPRREEPAGSRNASRAELCFSPAPVAASVAAVVDFQEDEEREILRFVRETVEHASGGGAEPDPLPLALAELPAYGVFVTLRRGTLLRACRGRWGGEYALGSLLKTAAEDAATRDHRFPAVHKAELPWLSIDVSLMHDAEPLDVPWEEVPSRITIGVHGIALRHPSGRGLLLPHVASEAGWDSESFLENLCRKAELAPEAWKSPEAALLRFEARRLSSPAPYLETDLGAVGDETLRSLAAAAQRTLWGEAVAADAIEPMAIEPIAGEAGVCLRLTDGRTAFAAGARPALLDLALRAARHLSADPSPSLSVRVARLVLFWRPIPLDARESPERHASLRCSAILARTSDRYSLVVGGGASDPIRAALAGLGMDRGEWADSSAGEVRVAAYSVRGIDGPFASDGNEANATCPAAARVRSAAVAGRFYPARRQEIEQILDRLLPTSPRSGLLRPVAILLPHAGWRYCGRIIGKTLANVDVPERVVILSPKHTPHGPAWSVSAADAWEVAGRTVPVDADLRRRVLEATPGLIAEEEAHREEHGIEVLVPFLLRRNPDARIVPIVLGRGDPEELRPLAEALAGLLADPAPPLLVVSSDLHHFADDAENRRRDRIAIEAMLSGDPERLWREVRAHDVSMCGVLPATAVIGALSIAAGGQPPSARLVDYDTSAAASGDFHRVVGYAGMHFELARGRP